MYIPKPLLYDLSVTSLLTSKMIDNKVLLWLVGIKHYSKY